MRVTIDLDAPSQLQLLKSYFNLKALNGGVHSRLSSSGQGYHLVVRGLPCSFGTSLNLRRFLGDDSNRVMFDEEDTGKPKQVLYRKRGKRTVTPLDEKNVLALPFFSKIKCPKVSL